jgi:hypothetical protein
VQDKKKSRAFYRQMPHAVEFMSTAPQFSMLFLFKITIDHEYGCIWINRIFTSAMEKYIVGKRSMECKQKQLGGLVRNKIKHRKKYKIGKSLTPLGKITIVL